MWLPVDTIGRMKYRDTSATPETLNGITASVIGTAL
jgi:hypothetical protein